MRIHMEPENTENKDTHGTKNTVNKNTHKTEKYREWNAHGTTMKWKQAVNCYPNVLKPRLFLLSFVFVHMQT